MTGIEERRFSVSVWLNPDDAAGTRVVQVVGNTRCIPGPTFKGAVRAAMERKFAALAAHGAKRLTPCVPASQLSDDERALVSKGERRQGCSVIVRDKKVDLPEWQGLKSMCPACTLFGAPGLVGFVRCGFLRKQGDCFRGTLRIIWRDESLGWQFGQPRTIGGQQVDILNEEAEKLLMMLLEGVRGLKSLGATRTRASDQIGGGARIRKVETTP